MLRVMERFFNTAGPCDSQRHYTLPWEDRSPRLRELIEQEHYFVIHAPRQVGKTTSFRLLARELTESGRYAALVASCEQGQNLTNDVDAGVSAVVRSIQFNARHTLPETLRPPDFDLPSVEAASRLSLFLESWVKACPLPVVLFLDEIDALLDTHRP